MSVLHRPTYALSLKQPWAALLVAGKKTIEMRKWATNVRGRVFIHAAKIADKRPEAWAWIDDELRPLTELMGGVIGTAELAACVRYRTPRGFSVDAAKHLNDATWFEAPQMFGFVFRGAKQVPFVPCTGNVRFFTVDLPEDK